MKDTSSVGIPPSNSGRQKWLMAAGIAVFCLFLYGVTIGHDYARDDMVTIKENAFVKKGISGIPDLFTTPYRHGYWKEPGESYRPFTLSTFAIEWAISPENPHLSHFINVLLYAGTCVLIFFFFTQIFGGKIMLFPLFIALLFAAHPIHVEVVANIKSRDEILAFLGGMLAMYALWKYWDTQKYSWLAAGLLAYTCALFSKESAITFLIIFPLVYWFFQKEFSVKALSMSLVFFVPVIIYLLARNTVLAGIDKDSVSVLNNVIVGAQSWGEETATAILFIGKYLWTLVFPHPLVSDVGFNQIPLTSWTDWRVLLTSAILVFLGVYATRTLFNKRQLWGFAIIFFFTNLSILSNLIIKIGTNYGDRLVYTASLGFVLALAYAITKFVKPQKAMIVCFAAIILLYSVKTVSRSLVWKDNLTLFAHDVLISPHSAKLNFQYGAELSKQATRTKDPAKIEAFDELSLAYFNKSLEIYPELSDACEGIGLVYVRQNKLDEALEYFKKAIGYSPQSTAIYRHIGAIYMDQNEFEKAKDAYQKAVVVFPEIVDAWKNLGNMNAMDGKFDAAIRCYTKALELAPNDALLNFQLGSLLRDTGKEELAKPYLKKAKELDRSLGE